MPSTQSGTNPKDYSLAGGRYVCQATLGCGTYGRVVQCFDRKFNRTVAVKISRKDPAYTAAANREFQVISSLQQRTRHTVHVFDHFEDGGRVCIGMELLKDTLYDLGKKRLEVHEELLHVEELRHMLFCLFTSLAELHRLGFIHCDIKPENAMIRPGGSSYHDPTRSHTSELSFLSVSQGDGPFSYRPPLEPQTLSATEVSGAPTGSKKHPVKPQGSPLTRSVFRGDVQWTNTCLIDYGAARRLEDNRFFMIQSLWYRAPEVLCSVPYSTAIDSWSMGCLCYEMLTGHPLFDGKDEAQQLELIVNFVGKFTDLEEQRPKFAVGHPSHSLERIKSHLRRRLAVERPETPVDPTLSTVPNTNASASLRGGAAGGREGQPQSYSQAGKAGEGGDQSFFMEVNANASSSRGGFSPTFPESDPSISIYPTSSPAEQHEPFIVGKMINTLVMTEDGKAIVVTVPSHQYHRKWMEELLVDLMAQLLCPDKSKRLSCRDALHHPFFTTITLTPSFSKSNSLRHINSPAGLGSMPSPFLDSSVNGLSSGSLSGRQSTASRTTPSFLPLPLGGAVETSSGSMELQASNSQVYLLPQSHPFQHALQLGLPVAPQQGSDSLSGMFHLSGFELGPSKGGYMTAKDVNGNPLPPSTGAVLKSESLHFSPTSGAASGMFTKPLPPTASHHSYSSSSHVLTSKDEDSHSSSPNAVHSSPYMLERAARVPHTGRSLPGAPQMSLGASSARSGPIVCLVPPYSDRSRSVGRYHPPHH